MNQASASKPPLNASTLIRDGGTLQLGIGSLGDAVTYRLKLRHERNELYVEILSNAGVLDRFRDMVECVGGTGRFEQGLYAASEMLVPGLLELHQCGALRRKVHSDARVQRLLNANGNDEQGRRSTALTSRTPFGTDLTPEEVVLAKALRSLKRIVSRRRLPRLRHLRTIAAVPDSANVFLARMDFAEPRSLKDRLLRKAVLYALASVDAI